MKFSFIERLSPVIYFLLIYDSCVISVVENLKIELICKIKIIEKVEEFPYDTFTSLLTVDSDIWMKKGQMSEVLKLIFFFSEENNYPFRSVILKGTADEG